MAKVRTNEIWPGDMVIVYDNLKGKFRDATVLARYGYVAYDMMRILGWSYKIARYPDCVDVQFSDRISRAHFTNGVRRKNESTD